MDTLRVGAFGNAADQAWVTTIDELRENGIAARIAALGDATPRPLAELCRRRGPRASSAPVGSEEWLRLMGSGAGEDLPSAFESR